MNRAAATLVPAHEDRITLQLRVVQTRTRGRDMKTLLLTTVMLVASGISGQALAEGQDLDDQATRQWIERQRLLEESEERLKALVVKMDAETRQIQRTKGAAERARLLEKHRLTMQETLEVSRALGGDTMQEVVAAHLDAAGTPSTERTRPIHLHKRIGMAPRTPEGNATRLELVETRLDMLQIIVEGELAQK